MNYGQSRNYLQKLQTFGVKLGLENIRLLLSALGDPHLKFPTVLVAGTNGKGSVCAMLSRILCENGFRPGLYTSPHLVKVEERIRIGEALIPRRDFGRLASLLKSRIEHLLRQKILSSPPTYFEFLTALACRYFHEESVDIAVLEVGMGGRLDATNVASPLISVVTSISRDHQEHLGSSLSRIAEEKAGIIKPGIPVICGVKKGVVHSVLKRRARDVGAPFFGVFDPGVKFRAKKRSRDYSFSFEWKGERYDYSPGLRGEHQGRNAAVAIASAVELGRRWRKLGKSEIIRGVRDARWAGRLETIGRRPLFILDGAHNEGGAAVLKKYIEDFAPKPLTLVFGAMKDKAIKEMANLLFPLARRVIVTRVPYARSASPEEIMAVAPEFKAKALLEPDVKKALLRALALAERSGLVLAAGSLFLVGEIKKIWGRNQGFRPRKG
jgi:dihydrofolate synthase/folylpolyglutamate synthase